MNEWMKEWMNEWMKEWMKEWRNEWMKEWMNEWMNGKDDRLPRVADAFEQILHPCRSGLFVQWIIAPADQTSNC